MNQYSKPIASVDIITDRLHRLQNRFLAPGMQHKLNADVDRHMPILFDTDPVKAQDFIRQVLITKPEKYTDKTLAITDKLRQQYAENLTDQALLNYSRKPNPYSMT